MMWVDEAGRFREFGTVEMGGGLKSEGELGVDVSEAHPLAVLYQTVALCSGWDSTRSKVPDVVAWPPLLYGFTDELRWAGPPRPLK